MATLFITLQGKGGVGKSFLTAAFAQWLIDRGRTVACIDTDTLNPTLLQYRPLQATHIRLSQHHVIDPRALDALVGIVNEAPPEAQVVVDVGSNGFETLMAYAVENGLFPLLEELGHQVIIQTVIDGGPDAAQPATAPAGPVSAWAWIWGGMLLGTGTTAVLTIAMVVWVQVIGR